jgi:EmrB/QacA subfamily drug resistance transporter
MLSVQRPPCDAGVIRTTARCAEARTLSPGRKRLVLAATVLGSSLAFIDGTVVTIALPAIQADLGAGTAQMQWIINAYLLLLGALVLVGGAAGDRYGRRRIFLAGISVFTIASLLCAAAPGAATLIGARALQGLGAAMLTPCSLAILGSTFDEQERSAAVGAWAGFGALTAAVGPVLGGWLVDAISWRAIFLINAPLAAITVALTLAVVPESRDANAKGLDMRGAVLATLALGALSFALTYASEKGLSNSLTIGALICGALLLVAFVMAERRGRAPMLPLDLFRSATFSGANLLTLLLYFALGGALFFLPFELIRLHGYSAAAAGAALLPFSVIMGLLSGAAGKLADHVGPRLPLTIGPLIAAAGFAALTLPEPGQPYSTGVGLAIAIVAFGMTIAVAPLTATVMGAAPAGREGVASGVNNAVARVAGLLAVAVMTVLFAHVFAKEGEAASLAQAQDALQHTLAASGEVPPEARDAFRAAYMAVMLTAAACAALSGIIAALMIRPPRRHAPAADL